MMEKPLLLDGLGTAASGCYVIAGQLPAETFEKGQILLTMFHVLSSRATDRPKAPSQSLYHFHCYVPNTAYRNARVDWLFQNHRKTSKLKKTCI